MDVLSIWVGVRVNGSNEAMGTSGIRCFRNDRNKSANTLLRNDRNKSANTLLRNDRNKSANTLLQRDYLKRKTTTGGLEGTLR